ncbi:hypothetical protein G6011_04096 [Alternaria panax]|uniref:Uncharacterized protein n=1 Tax=Alternaria panax TaxID=48097 RepID=A0AAD4NS57_9PLEO|nr:hypothetical protein G6011_04096 [Alternaria panax]
MATNVPQSREAVESLMKPRQEATPTTQPVIEAAEGPEFRSARASVESNPVTAAPPRYYSLNQNVWAKLKVGGDLVPVVAYVAEGREDGKGGWEYRLVDDEKQPIRIENETWFSEAQLNDWQK